MRSTLDVSGDGGRRRGSTESDKQVARAVRDRLLVVFHPAAGPVVQGWVMGLDDYHWVVIQYDRAVWLVHKSCPSVRLSTEQAPDHLVETIEPFRNYVMSEFFGRKPQE